MSTKLALTAKLDQRLAMNQQLRQAINLLQYNTLELKQIIQEHLETNPLIEAEDAEIDDRDTYFSHYSADTYKSAYYTDEENKLENFAKPENLRAHLLDQLLLCRFDKQDHLIAETIIDAIDEQGRLTMSIDEISRMVIAIPLISNEHIENILKKIQILDPIGVGARNAQECLLIQLNHMLNKNKIHALATQLVQNHFEMLASNNIKKIVKGIGASMHEFLEAMTLLRTLNPTPGLEFFTELETNIEPELYVKKIKNQWQVFLTKNVLTQVKLNTQYRDLIKKTIKQPNEPLQQALQDAQGLIKGLKRRNETLLAVASHIMELQKDFLETGATSMKPLNIIDVSYALDLHESTVSRITTGKYIATPKGVFELKYFFPSFVQTQTGGECSAIAVKALIKEIINQESDEHAWSDGEIATLLKKKGINIARRTVAKYREALRILPSFLRMQMHCS